MIFKLGMQHQGLKLYKVCINYGFTLTYLTARPNWDDYTFNGGNFAAKDSID